MARVGPRYSFAVTQLENLTREIAALRTEVKLMGELVTEVLDLRRPAPVSTRKAAALLMVGRDRLAKLVQGGHVRTVPWGARWRIPRSEVERIALNGLPVPGLRRRRRLPRQPPKLSVADEIRKIRIEDL